MTSYIELCSSGKLIGVYSSSSMAEGVEVSTATLGGWGERDGRGGGKLGTGGAVAGDGLAGSTGGRAGGSGVVLALLPIGT